ncbi:MAG: family 1 glycosylhydrolase [Gemmatimonadaceae bacterium]
MGMAGHFAGGPAGGGRGAMIEAHTAPPALEMWAGLECTVNRVGNRFHDQVERSGHARRPEDLEHFAALGLRTLRYPVLWEQVCPELGAPYDWRCADERLTRLRALGIEPIVGLVHHGSGPRGTNLVDPAFPRELARFAGAVAERYPWLRRFTPANEPLTTARFSGLYGHWFPHGQSALTFARAFLTQCRGVAQAMRAIREVIPDAQLVQTEDLGMARSTALLAYQADFENERRWLTFDALCGRLDRHHAMWDYFRWLGVDAAEMESLLAEPCPPSVMGINYYLTSERFLDERLERYPPHAYGGNDRHEYADVEAVRVCAEGVGGARELLAQAWERYGLPLAVTEAHLGCTREEQLRWLRDVWEDALALRAAGVDVRAVTAWSLLGTYDWASLMTRDEGRYEPGVFDVRAPSPRPTALAAMVRGLATTGRHDHPVLASPGWWRTDRRLLYPAVTGPGRSPRRTTLSSANESAADAAPILITGAAGTLGRAFVRICAERGLDCVALGHGELDLADAHALDAALGRHAPWAVVNAAGFVRVDDAERERDACFRANVDGAAYAAEACARHGIPLVTFSSDLVFDGEQSEPYVESDAPRPLNVYGATKAEAERRVLGAHAGALVVRTSAFFGPWDEHNFVVRVLRDLARGCPIAAADDATVSPTYVPDLVNACLDLLVDGEHGVWHLANEGAITWVELARRVAVGAGLDAGLVRATGTRALGLAARRPLYTVLASERGTILPSLDDALGRFLHEHRVAARAERFELVGSASAYDGER